MRRRTDLVSIRAWRTRAVELVAGTLMGTLCALPVVAWGCGIFPVVWGTGRLTSGVTVSVSSLNLYGRPLKGGCRILPSDLLVPRGPGAHGNCSFNSRPGHGEALRGVTWWLWLHVQSCFYVLGLRHKEV